MTEGLRYLEVSRRAFLRRSAAVGAVILFPGLAACGGGTTTTTVASSTTTLADLVATTLGTTTSTLAATTTTTATPPTAVADAPLPDGAEVLVAFTYLVGETREKVENPYLAVWIEDEDGELIRTLALWYKQSDKGAEWLADLTRWTRVDGSRSSIVSLSAATRKPGDYTLAWDGTDGHNKVMQGIYHVCVETAREHGPHSLMRTPVVLGSEPFQMALEPDGELVSGSVAMVVA